MQCYLVGGAVRDRLLGRAVIDRDFVVVGSSTEAMLRAGFRQVGADFPVFLHPDSGEEYALARTERKSGRGYQGFVVHADPQVTLEQDLARRDLTINAMAEDAQGQLVDPFGGARDLQARWLRHVSPAFVEDPVRVLRLARFAARLAPLGFRVAPETRRLLRQMVSSGEVDHLVPERVFAELRRALVEARPSAFLQVLRECGALARLLPEVQALYGVPQRRRWHPEIDAGWHTELVLEQAARLAPGDERVAFCALTHDLGKALTPAEHLPGHPGHEGAGVAPLEALCERLRVPRELRELAVQTCRHHLTLHRYAELRPGTALQLIEAFDGLRRPERLAVFASACEADKRGRIGLELSSEYPQAQTLLAEAAAARAVSTRPLLERGLQGPKLGAALRQARVEAIAALRKAAA
ncbi:MAG: multifunctional CCA addition/repair protein [Xanthomonadales bacterium]|nr:multifunctional CCA addition/repair protein [Xanthomonadales bacterium]MCB1635157.1 multifunctional CCA addition/repair protein [Xanthomonadales bacterium]MCB1642989.1 multifunctional CCA addition/repair protein [Xanthomonadales bacterium]